MRWNEFYKISNQSNCAHKLTFTSFADASAYNKKAPRKLPGNKRKEKLHPYRCYVCQQWHIGHRPPRIKRRKQDERE